MSEPKEGLWYWSSAVLFGVVLAIALAAALADPLPWYKIWGG